MGRERKRSQVSRRQAGSSAGQCSEAVDRAEECPIPAFSQPVSNTAPPRGPGNQAMAPIVDTECRANQDSVASRRSSWGQQVEAAAPDIRNKQRGTCVGEAEEPTPPSLERGALRSQLWDLSELYLCNGTRKDWKSIQQRYTRAGVPCRGPRDLDFPLLAPKVLPLAGQPRESSEMPAGVQAPEGHEGMWTAASLGTFATFIVNQKFPNSCSERGPGSDPGDPR